jgi:hypothetical protein
MTLAASTYAFGDGLLTVLEIAFLFLWIWIAISVVFDIFRNGAERGGDLGDGGRLDVERTARLLDDP